ncbi:MAG: ubiquinol-cytochrome c reductase iron-sulfur subunit [Chloracidobacterium sp.]|nr:ubiquinol-cytochrome c reductase iron-sulfur subunit [Chloracidobacterium sp.]MDW8215992.1 ubiquinol-cytochrome c reductase iron-sulfur subunit [Acidobacteriota bacterium]
MSELSEVDKTKRFFMGLGSIVIGAGIGGALAYPIFQFAIGNALKTGKDGDDKNWIDLGSVTEFEEGKPTARKITIEVRDGWVKSSSDETVWVMKQGDKFLTFTATCPHLGCKVNWVPERNEYFCPCHNSAFDITGERKPGSASARGLDTLEYRVTDDKKLQVVFQKFKNLLPEKEVFS